MAVAAVLFTGTLAKADFVIDTFTAPNPATTYSLSAAVGSTYTQTDSLAGGITRALTVTQTENLLGLAGSSNGVIGNTALGGRYVLNTNTNTTAWSSLLYTYSAPQNLSVGGTSVQFTFSSADLNTPFSVKISDGTVTKTQVGVVTSASVGTSYLPMSGFSGDGFDASHVVSIELQLNRNALTGESTSSADFSLSDVRVTTPPPAVPAPPAAVLLLAAAPIVGLIRRRKVTA